MGHMLDITNETASFATARQPAWHRLGTVLPELMTAEQALREAHLADWDVRKLPLTTSEITDDGVTSLDVQRYCAAVRTNPITGRTDVLGVVGDGFTHVQNEEQVAFLQALVDEGGAFIETAGALRGGRQVFFCCKLPETLLVGGQDPVDLYLSSLNGHDGSMAFRSIISPIRVVCANTQHAALATARQSWSHRHTAGAKAAIEEARRELSLAFRYSESFQAEADRMIDQALTDAEFEKIVTGLYAEPEPGDTRRSINHKIERLDTIRGLYHDAGTQSGIRGTRWGAYQAITEYEDWAAPVRAAQADKDARRALRAIDGDGVKAKERAFAALRVPVNV